MFGVPYVTWLGGETNAEIINDVTSSAYAGVSGLVKKKKKVLH